MSFYGYDPDQVTDEQTERVHAAAIEWIYSLLDLMPDIPKFMSIQPVDDDHGGAGYEALDEHGTHWIIFPELMFIQNTFRMAEGDV